MQAGPAAPAAAAAEADPYLFPELDEEPDAQSALLSCLSRLDFQLNDVLTAHLLPKLIEQGSAGAVRLTCSQLHSLLQPSIQHLNLTKGQQDADHPFHSL